MFSNNLLKTYSGDKYNMKESFYKMCKKASFGDFFTLIESILENGLTSDRKIVQLLQSEVSEKDHPQNNPKYDVNRSKKIQRLHVCF